MADVRADDDGTLSETEICGDARTLAFRLFRALPDSLTGLRMLHLMARPPRFLWPRNVEIGMRMIESHSGRSIPVWILRPHGAVPNLPLVLNLHGGGHAIGAPQQDFLLLARFIADTPCIMATPDYRLSPRAPYPAALEDCAEALNWLCRNAAGLQGDATRLHIIGHSSGGGLAAALGLMTRDGSIPALAGLLLIGAMLDDRTGPSDKPDGADLTWNAARNTLAWRLYLRDFTARASVPETAAPARANDLSGLPTTLGVVGAADLFVRENRCFFERLASHGVQSSLTVVPHAYHGIEVLAPKSKAGKALLAAIRASFARMLEDPTM